MTQLVLDWLGQHPATLAAGILLIALVESLAGIGLVVPGVALLAACAALAGAGQLPLSLALLAAGLGAFFGDGISYWLGHHYRQRIYHWHWVQRHSRNVLRGERFFRDYGIAGIMAGRFIGPLRPIMPLLAGALGMRPRHYLLANSLSVVMWAPAYILPGFWAGSRLGAERLQDWAGWAVAVTAAILIFLVWSIRWLTRDSEPPDQSSS